MKLAITYENGMVGQHFGHTEQFAIFEINDQKEIVANEIINTNGAGHGALAGFLKERNVDVLICGGIGMGARVALEEVGIELLPGVTGDIDEVVEAYLKGSLNVDFDATCHHHEGEHDCNHSDCEHDKKYS